MSIWELRQAIESAIPVWIVIPVIVLWGLYMIRILTRRDD